MEKIFKLLMLGLMVAGLGFSTSLFVGKSTIAQEERFFSGMWVFNEGGTYDCVEPGDECGIGKRRRHAIDDSNFSEELATIEKKTIAERATILKFDDIKPERIEFSPKAQLPLKPGAFCVTEDDFFIITDSRAGDIKIYEKKEKSLELVRNLGRKGFGRTEFIKPVFCFYSAIESKFGVMDMAKRKISIYDRIGKDEFLYVEEIPCINGAHGFQLVGDKLLISGYYLSRPNRKPHDFYYFDLKKKKTTSVLPSNIKYGLDSEDEYEKKIFKTREINSIGTAGFFDMYENEVFFAWEGDLKVFKLNIKSGVFSSFGEKKSHFKKKPPSPRLIEGYRTKNINVILSERAKMDYVRNVFASSEYVLVIYEGPVKQDRASNFRMQLYTHDGYFLKDLPLPGKPGRKMWFDKDKQVLYSLADKLGESPGYIILEYKINLKIGKG